jgi:hypothetical protein
LHFSRKKECVWYYDDQFNVTYHDLMILLHDGSKPKLWKRKRHPLLSSSNLNSRPLVGNGLVSTFPWQPNHVTAAILSTQQQRNCWRECSLLGRCRDYVRRANWVFTLIWWQTVCRQWRPHVARSQRPGVVAMRYESHQPARTGAAEHGSWGIYSIGSHFQATPNDHIANWEDSVHAAANCKECEIAAGL